MHCSGANDGSLRSWYVNSDISPWEGTTTAAPIKMLSFHKSATGLCMYRRSDKGAVEIWDFGEEKDKQVTPKASWHTNDRCSFAEQAFGSNISVASDGWLLDGDLRLCWIPKNYRPRDTIVYFRGGRLTMTTVKGSLLILDLNTMCKT